MANINTKKFDESVYNPARNQFNPDTMLGTNNDIEDMAESLYDTQSRGTFTREDGSKGIGYGVPADIGARARGVSYAQLKKMLPPQAIAYQNVGPDGKPVGSGFFMMSARCSQNVLRRQVNLSSPSQYIEVPFPKHEYPRPVCATKGVLEDPHEIILHPKGYFTTKMMIASLKENTNKLAHNLHIVCYECVIDKVNELKKIDPARFIDLKSNRLAME
jgi:hypothetical protein